MDCHPSQKLKFNRTPDSAVDYIISTLGMAFMQKLAHTLGGLEIKVPQSRSLHEQHRLVLALGMDDAISLCDAFCGERLDIPHGRRQSRDERHRSYIVKALLEGKTNAVMALEMGFTEREVRRKMQRLGIKRHDYASANQNGEPFAAELVRAFRNGKTVSEIADFNQLTAARVYIRLFRAGIPADELGECPVAVSNGGLTGLTSRLSPSTSPNHETRASAF
ncbi:MAG: hypothetical protein KF874_07035 [Rhizobiaceae bacterium]|nr:hypothetical protein [Rhizobiaceae bacterium]